MTELLLTTMQRVSLLTSGIRQTEATSMTSMRMVLSLWQSDQGSDSSESTRFKRDKGDASLPFLI